ncbi:ABC transporter ATP-binding protein [Candidatus Atribacteria bacterium 1244-E10-H5-B2]|nr:MAG: ABC transporter ATP-binding protein [Candidatus Atribacteria bacterium 1244-E10-H5-B2]
MNILELQEVTMRFGGLVAVDNVTFQVPQGNIFGIIGPNGSGKTTLFNVITGIYRATAGQIKLFGENIVGLEPENINAKGISRTFQNPRLFNELSIIDNLLVGMHPEREKSIFADLLGGKIAKQRLKKNIDEVLDLLSILDKDLVTKVTGLIKDLNPIQNRRVEIIRALASHPKLVLLDEPSAGMNPDETDQLMEDIAHIREQKKGITIVIIEHDMRVIKNVTKNVVALNFGKKIAEGTFVDLAKNFEVREAYLGKEAV